MLFLDLEKNTNAFVRTIVSATAFYLFIVGTIINAQPCTVPIQNNTIQITPATCTGTVATLKGSDPTGGNGQYTYRWERARNCIAALFAPISGATERDYAVPSTADPNDCYRRVVISATCTSTSPSARVTNQDRTNPPVPTTVVVQPTCATGTGSITVTSPAPAAGITYSIDGANYNNTTGVFTGLNPGSYSVTAKFIADCISPSKNDVLNPLPAVTGTISPSNVSFCAGGSQVLTATGGQSYRWYRNGTLISGATSNTYTATTSGTYSADIIVGVCTGKSSNNATITVTPLPTGTISPATASICTGGTTTLTATGGTSYQWYRNNIPISGATSATYVANSAGTYTADIFSSSCGNKASNSAVVTVATPTGTITPATGLICSGNSVQLTATGGGTYQWYKDGVIITGAATSTYLATAAGTYSVIINSGGCSGPGANVATITQGIVPSGLISPAAVTLCPGNTTTLTAITAAGGSTYQWFRNGTLISGATTATYVASQTGTYSVLLSNGSCNGTAVNTASVLAADPITFTSNATHPNCTSTTGSITISGVAGGGGGSRLYSKDNGASFQAGSSFNNLPAGTYQVVVKDSAGCVSPPKAVTITPFVSTLTASGNTVNARCGQANGSITMQASGGTSPYTYSLDNGSYQTSNTFNNLPFGNHKVTVKDAAGCLFDFPFLINLNGLNPILAIVNPSNICPGFAANLRDSAVTSGSDTGLVFTYWADTTAATALPNPQAVTAGTYYIKATNAAGCTAIRPVTVKANLLQDCINESKIVVPTAFTPNNNGANDLLRPLFYKILALRYFKVYNRWGQLVYQTNEAGKGWDGKLKGIDQPSEVYSWVVECLGLDGKLIRQSGRTLLVR